MIQRELGAAEAQSEETLRSAMALHESALRDRPDDPRLRAGMARCCANLGILGLDPVHPRMVRRRGPAASSSGPSACGRACPGPSRISVDYPSELANAYNLVAVLHANNDRMPESLRALQTSIALRERLAAEHPDDPSCQNDLASSLNNLGALVQR